MYTTCIQLETVEEAKRFVRICAGADFPVELAYGTYVVDAKSILGIFSLDLSKQLEVRVHCGDEAVFEAFSEKIRDFLAK